MSNFNFKEELEDQKKELVEQYGEDIAVHRWNDDDIYDGEYCNPPSYRWSAAFLRTSRQFTKCPRSDWLWAFFMYYINVRGLSNDLWMHWLRLSHFSTGFSTGMTEQTPSQHDERPQDDKEDNSPTVHTYGLKDGESITFPVHQKKSSWPVVPI